MVESRNQLDGLIHSTQKSLDEHGDKLESSDKTNIEEALKSAKTSLESGDKDSIEKASQDLATKSQKLYEKIANEQGAGQSEGVKEQKAETKNPEDEKDIVDAEFEEVKDDKQSNDDAK